MITKHTPKPWRAYGNPVSPRIYISEDGCKPPFAIVEGRNKEANAALIAAAPDLLAACIILVEHFDSLPDDTERCRVLKLALNHRTGELMKEAITKATKYAT